MGKQLGETGVLTGAMGVGVTEEEPMPFLRLCREPRRAQRRHPPEAPGLVQHPRPLAGKQGPAAGLRPPACEVRSAVLW